MIERLPSLNIIRPVKNIGEEDFAYIERNLASRETDPELASEAYRLFEHMGRLRATVISHGELERLHRSLHKSGREKINKERVEELAGFLGSVLPDFSREPISVPTLPSEIHTSRRRKALTIAGSPEVLQERILVKEAVRDFYGLDAIPHGVWLDDNRTARVRLARARNAAGNRSINKMQAAFKIGTTLLPRHTELEPVDIRHIP